MEYAGSWSDYVAARDLARSQQYARVRASSGPSGPRCSSGRAPRRRGPSRAKRNVKKSGEPDKNIRHAKTERSEKQAAKAKITERAMERLEAVEKPWEGWELRLQLAPSARSGDVVVRLERRGRAAGDASSSGPIDLEIGWQERIAILGPNGSGKTTLLRALLGEIPLDVGPALDRARACRSGRWTSPRAQLPDDEPLIDGFRAATGHAARRGAVAAGEVRPHRRARRRASAPSCHRGSGAGRSSPGSWPAGVNCLVLDEPTNHLDLEAIEQLELALDGYDGTLLLVSHDRRLLDTVRITRTIDLSSTQPTALGSTRDRPGWVANPRRCRRCFGSGQAVPARVPAVGSFSPISSGKWQATKWSGRTSRICGSSAAQHVLGAAGSGCGTGSRSAGRAATGSRRRRRRAPRGVDRRVGHRDRREQRRGVRVRGRLVELVGPADLADLAEVHDGDPVADVLHHREVVGDEDQRQAVARLHVLEQVEDLRLHRHVERGDRLVADDQLRLGRDRAGDRDALALAAGELVRAPVAGLRRGSRPTASSTSSTLASRSAFVADASRCEALGDDVLDLAARVQRRDRVLEDHLHLRAQLAQVLARERR